MSFHVQLSMDCLCGLMPLKSFVRPPACHNEIGGNKRLSQACYYNINVVVNKSALCCRVKEADETPGSACRCHISLFWIHVYKSTIVVCVDILKKRSTCPFPPLFFNNRSHVGTLQNMGASTKLNPRPWFLHPNVIRDERSARLIPSLLLEFLTQIFPLHHCGNFLKGRLVSLFSNFGL